MFTWCMFKVLYLNTIKLFITQLFLAFNFPTPLKSLVQYFLHHYPQLPIQLPRLTSWQSQNYLIFYYNYTANRIIKKHLSKKFVKTFTQWGH